MYAYCFFCETQRCKKISELIRKNYDYTCFAPQIIQRKWVKGVPTEEMHDWLPGYDTLALTGFNRAGEKRGQGRHPRANCAYTLRTNATEYARFLQRALLEGEGLSKEAHEEMFTHQVHAQRYADEPRD